MIMSMTCYYSFCRFKQTEGEGLGKEDITELVENQQDLKFLEKRVELYHDYIRGKQAQIIELENEIHRLKAMDIYDGVFNKIELGE